MARLSSALCLFDIGLEAGRKRAVYRDPYDMLPGGIVGHDDLLLVVGVRDRLTVERPAGLTDGHWRGIGIASRIVDSGNRVGDSEWRLATYLVSRDRYV